MLRITDHALYIYPFAIYRLYYSEIIKDQSTKKFRRKTERLSDYKIDERIEESYLKETNPIYQREKEMEVIKKTSAKLGFTIELKNCEPFCLPDGYTELDKKNIAVFTRID
jgi:hypothetical protein